MIGYFNRYIQKYWAPRKTKTYTELGLSLILIIVFVFFAIKPTVLTIFELRQTISEGKKANSSLDEKIRSLNLAQTNFEKIKNDLDLIDTALPKKPLILDFLNRIDALAAKYGLSLSSVQNQKVSEVKGVEIQGKATSFGFTISGKGSYENFTKFLKHLEDLPRPVKITSLELSKNEEGGVDFSVQGETYYLATSD